MSKFVLTAQLQLQAPNNVAQVVRQIQSQLNNVNVNVQVQGAAQAQKQLQQVAAQTKVATTAADKMGRAFAVSVRRFAAFSIATRTVGLFTSTLADAVKAAIDFERQLVKVSQVTGDSLDKLKGLTKSITDLSTSLGVPSQSLLEVSTLLLQAGINAKDTETALKTLAKAALAPNFDSITETAEGAIAVLAQFGQGVDALESQLGSINAVAGSFAVEAGDLIDVIRRTGGVFKSSGGSLNELLALFTSVRATTRESAESIGTALKTIFTRIQRPKTIEFLKQFGVELVNLEGKFVGPFEAVIRLNEALSGLGEGDLTFIRIAEELGGYRQIGKVLPLLQQTSMAQEALNVAQKSGTSLAKDAITAQQALAVRIVKVKEEFLALVRGVTETSTFQIMANTALAFASALIKISEAIKPLLPLLAALAAVNLTKGIGSFAASFMGGLKSGRTYSQGGQVHKFAKGGLVPGQGNRDTVPALLSPGEFVIRKSSVNKLGAANLAAMNENRFAVGGIATRNIAGMAIPDTFGTDNLKTSTVPISTLDIASATPQSGLLKSGSLSSIYALKNTKTVQANIPNKLPLSEFNAILNSTYGFKSKSYATKTAGVSNTEKQRFNDILSQQMRNAIRNGAADWSTSVGVPLAAGDIKFADTFSLNPGLAGTFFESVIDAFQGRPVGAEASENKRPFDFINGLRGGANSRLFANLNDVDYIDAKKSVSLATDSEYRKKIASQLALDGADDMALAVSNRYKTLLSQSQRKHFGGIIQKFAKGGMAQAPLIDDIINATGTVMPRPSSAISALIRAGGGAIDIDRTLKRTIGDKAYGMAKTSGQQSAALDKFFRDPQARLRDVTSAPLTTFGKELQTAIKSGQLSPGKLSIISKSSRVPGVAEYLSRLFGIPLANMIFTSGGSKQPAMDALRSKGPRVNRVARFAAGGGVGTDTVPALLTPGEFVVNRSSAQKIGYGNLNRMNKIGRYATGGIVQRFGNGSTGPVTAAPSSGGSLAAFDAFFQKNTQAVEKNTSAQDSSTKSVKDVVTNNKMFAASMAVSLIQGFLPAIDENSSAITRMTHSFVGIVSTLTTVGFALEAFGVALNVQAITGFLSGATSLTQVFGNISGQFGGLNNIIGSVTSKFGGFTSKLSAFASKNLPTAGRVSSSISGSMVGKSFAGGLAGQSGAFGFASRTGFGGMSGRMGSSARLTTMSNMSSLERAISNLSGRLGNFVGGLRSGLAGGRGVGGFTARAAGPLTNQQMLTTTPAQRLAAMRGQLGAGGQSAVKLGSSIGNAGKSVTDALKGIASNINKSAGLALGIGIAFKVFSGMIDSFSNHQGKLNQAIEKGNVEQAKKSALEAAGADAVNTLAASALALGSAFGPPGVAIAAVGAAAIKVASELPLIGPAVKYFATEIVRLFGGNTSASIEALAASQAGAVRTQKALQDAQTTATRAMEDFENGTISAAEALAKIDVATSEAVTQQKRASDFATKNLENRASGGFTGRNIASFLSFGLVESSSQRNQRLGEQSAEEIRKAAKFMADRFQMMIAARTESIRSAAFRGSDTQAASGLNDLRALRLQQEQQASALLKAGDMVGFEAMKEAAKQTADQINQTEREIANLTREVEIAKKQFAALNLGFRSVTAASDAAALRMTNLTAGFEVGGTPAVQAAATLEAALTSAGQNISKIEFDNALSQVNAVFKQFGAGAEQISKFNNLISGVAGVQREFPQIFQQLKQDLLAGDLKDIGSPEAIGKKFQDIVSKQLEAAGIGEAARKQIIAAMGDVKIGPEDVAKITSGDFSVLEKYLGDAAKEVQETMRKVIDNYVKVNQELIKLTQQRIEAERNFIEAQKEAIDLLMEGREVQAKYGGRSVSQDERRAAIVAKANANRAGIPNLRTGSAAELRARNAQIAGRFFDIEARRRVQGGMAGREGVERDATQQDLVKAQKDQIQTIRDMIKLEEESLRIIQEKNKLEKDSLNALVTGDIEKFFEQQAAVGAQAALATGDRDFANMFGAKAVGEAFLDITRQMEAGVDSLFGRQLAGPGGLAEQAAAALLAARGVNDPRMAQMMAGTSPEEQGAKQRLQELGGLLGETGAWMQAMSEMELQTAQINVANAEIKVKEVERRGREMAANMNRGGVVYANRGIFVPRGTDTVPAMLTPGEFVVRRQAVNRGNNLQLLKAINNGGASSGYARGGKVGYYANGGVVDNKSLNTLLQNAANVLGINNDLITNLANTFNNFNSSFAESIRNLQNTKLHLTLDSVNVNVNINGGFLNKLGSEAQTEIMKQVVSEIRNRYRIGNNGNIVEKAGNLPQPGQGS